MDPGEIRWVKRIHDCVVMCVRTAKMTAVYIFLRKGTPGEKGEQGARGNRGPRGELVSHETSVKKTSTVVDHGVGRCRNCCSNGRGEKKRE